MTNDLTTTGQHPALATMPAGAQTRGITPESWHVMKTVLFKGASDEMICTLVDYCKASRRDPLKRPFHIVKVYDSDAGGMVESIWPSIGELRTTAVRTGQYAGKSEIKFGPEMTKTWEDGNRKVTMTFPEWAQCSVYRICGGERVEFAGTPIYWLETYASKRGGVPNAMWQKRPRGQLAKCAEADALRSAFPEEWGTQPTSDEMEGQTIGHDETYYGPIAAKDVTQTSFGRARFAEPEPENDHDPVTGEVVEAQPQPQPNGNGAAAAKERGRQIAQAMEQAPDADALRKLYQRRLEEIAKLPTKIRALVIDVYDAQLRRRDPNAEEFGAVKPTEPVNEFDADVADLEPTEWAQASEARQEKLV